MKKTNRKHNKTKPIKELAEELSNDLDSTLPVSVLPNGSVVYKNYIVKQTKNNNWGLFYTSQGDLIEEFFLKTCALMAAKAYSKTNLEKYVEIKQLDTKYRASYCDNLVYRKNIKTAKEFERYMILLNKLEESDTKVKYYKETISRMFKWSFV